MASHVAIPDTSQIATPIPRLRFGRSPPGANGRARPATSRSEPDAAAARTQRGSASHTANQRRPQVARREGQVIHSEGIKMHKNCLRRRRRHRQPLRSFFVCSRRPRRPPRTAPASPGIAYPHSVCSSLPAPSRAQRNAARTRCLTAVLHIVCHPRSRQSAVPLIAHTHRPFKCGPPRVGNLQDRRELKNFRGPVLQNAATRAGHARDRTIADKSWQSSAERTQSYYPLPLPSSPVPQHADGESSRRARLIRMSCYSDPTS